MTFPFRHPNWPHQEKEFAEGRDLDARALLWGMRTGKTKAAIDLACYRHSLGEVEALLILAPNGVHLNWTRLEVPVHTWESTPVLAHAWRSDRSETADHKASLAGMLSDHAQSLRVFAINPEALRLDRAQAAIRRLLQVTKGRILYVADESHKFRRAGARMTSLARTLAHRCSVRRILTGTPVLNSPLHAYSQFDLLSKRALGFESFKDFKERYASYRTQKTRAGRRIEILDQYLNLEELRGKIAGWSSLVLRHEVQGMPELLRTQRLVPLSDPQRKAYRALAEDFILALDDGEEITVIETIARLTKMQQVLGGFIIDANGQVHSIDDNPPRLEALVDEVSGGLPGKTIVWCRFREDIRRASLALSEAGLSCVEYHGGISQGQREINLARFQKDHTITCLVGQPQAGGEGRDMSAADSVVWYSRARDNIICEQATERATKIGKGFVTVTDLVGIDSLDEQILAGLALGRGLSDILAGSGLRKFLDDAART